MLNIRQQPELGVIANKPTDAVDHCFDQQGQVIAAGTSVWDGDWNQLPTGECSKRYPRFKTSREVAGGGVAGDLFKCHLQPVAEAIARGIYGDQPMAIHRQRLESIFPAGVCDYSRGDAARPADLLSAFGSSSAISADR